MYTLLSTKNTQSIYNLLLLLTTHVPPATASVMDLETIHRTLQQILIVD